MSTAKDKLITFLSNFPILTPEEAKEISDNLNFIAPLKGDVILEEGVIPNECYFVLEGCVRQYHINNDGDEVTTAIYAEDEGAVSTTDYTNKTPSKNRLVCVEDCILLAGNPEKDKEMFEKFPKLQAITFAMMEKDLVNAKDKLISYTTSTPTERYEALLKKRPHLFNRVPLHQIASLLGMTPETLSRIRKKLSVTHR